jgi:uncharacterized membrane protein
LIVLVTLTVGLILWIVAWSFDIKAFDAFMVTVLLVVLAAAYTMAKPFIDQLLGREAASMDEKGGTF